MSNTFGKILTLTSFGESHGMAIGGVIDGFPANVEIDFNFITSEINKRKPGNSKITSTRKEQDKVIFLSGIFENKTLGSPIAFITHNNNVKTADYNHLKNIFRPGHADFTYQKKYNIRDYRGGGRASARETFSRVVAGAFAKILLKKYNISILAFTSQVGTEKYHDKYQNLNLNETYNYESRIPDEQFNQKFINIIEFHKKTGNSVGGIVTCVIKNAPIGLGEPVFDKFHAKLAQAIMSINACKGFEIGQGFNSATLSGTENNDELLFDDKTNFSSNNSGGVLGGITTGQDIYFNAAFKPTPTISKPQKTINNNNKEVILQATGRHDPCVVPRAVIIVEAMTALTIADFILQKNSHKL